MGLILRNDQLASPRQLIVPSKTSSDSREMARRVGATSLFVLCVPFERSTSIVYAT